MITKAQQPFVSSRRAAFLLGSAALIGLSLTSFYRYLLFHRLAELFSLVVAFAIFALIWNLCRFLRIAAENRKSDDPLTGGLVDMQARKQ